MKLLRFEKMSICVIDLCFDSRIVAVFYLVFTLFFVQMYD